ncbi:MAG: hypothetical protein AB7Q45_04550 [Planctomycetaceae bacterium]
MQARSGDTTRVIPPFQFTVDINNDGISNEAGVWSRPGSVALGAERYEFDVDCDGDGMRDAIWVDLDFPLFDLPDGRQFVALFACKVIDADALLNVNAHGNMNGVLARQWDGDAINASLIRDDLTANFLHASNLGLSRSEINLGLGLTANPDPTIVPRELADDPAKSNAQELADAQQQHALNLTGSTTFPGALTPAALSNLELLALLAGRENWRDTPGATHASPLDPPNFVSDNRIEGRWGDDFQIPGFYRWLRSNTAASNYSNTGMGFSPPPAPGAFLIDDDGDSNMLGYSSVFGNGTRRYPVALPAGFAPDDDLNAPFVGDFVDQLGRSGGGSAYRDPHLLGLWIPPFVHPLDYGGTGAGYLDASGVGAGTPITRRRAGQMGVTSPAVWPTYTGANTFWQYQYTGWDPTLPGPVGGTNMVQNPFVQNALSGEYRTLYGVLPYWESLDTGNDLQQANALLDFLRDDGDEVILSRNFRNPEYDAVFPTHEMEGLHFAQQDYDKVGGTSRLRELASVNFDKTNADAGRRIRSRFTTDSWDRLDFGHGHSVNATEDRAWEFTPWNGTGEFAAGDGTFPPEFTGATGPAGGNDDPLRPELRLLLRSELGYNDYLNPASSNPRFPRHRLNINRILSDDDPTGGTTAFDVNDNPRFRNLTPHPDVAALNLANTSSWAADQILVPAMIHSNDPSTIPANTPFANFDFDPASNNNLATASDLQRENLARTQEWWARYDRQRLARDIYTLLYTLGHGNDGLNVTTQPYPTQDADSNGRNDFQEELAQFAVNVVDALDRDDVITEFEYDDNLTDGWNPTGKLVKLVKNGVEAQQLTFSEVMWIRAQKTAMDEPETMWDDTEAREFLYIELRNASPFDVEMRDDSWRISRYNPGSPAGTPDASFVFKTDPDTSFVNGQNVVKAGKTYLIGCHDNSAVVNINGTNELRSSDLYINDGVGAGFDQIVPFRIDGTDGSEPALPAASSEHPAPTLDLDLSYTNITGADHQERFEFDNLAPVNPMLPMQNRNTLVSTGTDTMGTDWTTVNQFTLVLERRRNLRTDGIVDQAADDWVEVDRFEVPAPRLINASGDLTDQLPALRSSERSEPLNRDDAPLHTTDNGTPPHSHTLGNPDFTVNGIDDDDDSLDRNRGNSNAPGGPGAQQFTIWQPHFDRDFSSVFELLSVPVIGPDQVTQRLVDTNTSPKRLNGWYDQSNPMNRVPALAGARFMTLDPNGDSDLSNATTLDDDNRWYRLFEFLAVPDGGDDAIRERLDLLVRTPGKININTVRDEAVLAAILDDAHIGRFGTADSTDDSIEALRNWFTELQLARDGIDPLNWAGPAAGSKLALPLPGVPGVPSDPAGGTVQFGSVPFRSQSYVAPNLTGIWPIGSNLNKIAHTLLRMNATDDTSIFDTSAGLGTGTATRAAALDQLGLFEARPTGDIPNDAVDFHTRNRLLAKVANHTTNRSNVFAVWLTVGFFEAHQPDPLNTQVVQIGGEMAGMNRHRAFFIIDRTRLEEAVEVDDKGTPGTADDIITLNWRSFLLHRRSLPEK